MSLAMKGLRTGLLDADIYGPSIPLLLKAKDATVRRSSINMKNVCPLTADSNDLLKFISFGHVNPNAGAPGAVKYRRYLVCMITYIEFQGWKICRTNAGSHGIQSLEPALVMHGMGRA